ncbi:MAG: YdeI/OmpD-associated family protein [Gemmatimonadaceae bacterium]
MGKRDKRVDAYIAKAAPFARPILTHVRTIVHAASPSVDEDIKWGMPWFCHKGKLLAYMSAFTAHVGFYRGALVMGTGAVKRDAMGSFGRLTSVNDLPSKATVAKYVKKAVALAEQTVAGAAPRRTPKPMPKLPAALARALRADAALREQWNAFTPGKRRAYLAWIAEARQEATRERRLATTIAQVREGKSQNWRYERSRG